MARGGRGGHPAQRKHVDLTGTISLAEKNDLVTLITAVTEKMIRDITNGFDSPQVSPVEEEDDVESHFHCLSLGLHHHLRRELEKSRFSSGISSDPKPLSYMKTHLIIEKEEKSSVSCQLGELKKEALAYFSKWQTGVIQRLKDIHVSAAPEPTPGRGRGARGSARGRGTRSSVRGGGRGGLTLATGPPRAPTHHVDHLLAKTYTPIPNTLWTLPVDRRKLFLHIVLLILLSLHEYTANSHILLANIASSLNLPKEACHQEETRLAQGLTQAALELSAEKAIAQKEENKLSKRWKFSLGTPNNGTVKLAPPLFAVGIGTSRRGWGLTSIAAAGLLGAMSDNGLLMGSMFGFNTIKPLNRVIEGFTREIQDFAFMSLRKEESLEYLEPRQTQAGDRRLRVVIAMSGFILGDSDITRPWTCIGQQVETYAIQWELASLQSLGSSLETAVKSSAWQAAKEDIRKDSIFTSLIKSEWPHNLLKISKILDNPWSIGMVRAEKIGAILADAIMRHKVQGERPVSLVGYSLAARSIYACLMVLAERRHFGLIDSVVMIGAPAPSDSRVWLTLKSVVSGRLINVYSEQDYILGFLYRTSNIQFGIAGLQEVQGADGVENYRVPRLDQGHLSYRTIVPKILRDVGWEDVGTSEVARVPHE